MGISGTAATQALTVNVASAPLVTVTAGPLSTTKKGITSLVLKLQRRREHLAGRERRELSPRDQAGKDKKKFGTK